MRKIIIVVLSFLFSSYLLAQDTLRIKWANEHYLKAVYEKNDAGKIIDTNYHFKDTLPDGFYKLFHKNDILAEQGNFKNSIKQGQWAYWKLNGTIYSIENYNKGKLNGSKKVFWENSLIKESLNYKNGKQVGYQIKLDKAGKQLSKTILDENGNGTYRVWNPKQSVVESGFLKNWKKDGVRTIKSTIDGKLVLKDYWEKGKKTRKP